MRYGVMCADDGVVFDDGVTGRLGEDHYLMSTTSSGAGAVREWVENWLQTAHRDWRVHVTPLTTAFASINVAGPRSRDLLGRLVRNVDLSAEAFPYMHVRTGTIAGVADCHMWRIGFTGELSYESTCPPVSACTSGRLCCPPVPTSGRGLSASKRSGSCASKKGT